MSRNPRLTNAYVATVATFGSAVLGYGVLHQSCTDTVHFLALLAMAVGAARMKLKFPGLDGNMSASIPFVLIAAAQMSLSCTLAIACGSVFVQCLPKRGDDFRGVQMLFNVSNMAISSAATWYVFNVHSFAPTVMVALAAVALFLGSSVPVATVISLSDRRNVARIWKQIALLSFPFYVLSAGIAAIVVSASEHVGWQGPAIALPVMYAVYRSYRMYFGQQAHFAELQASSAIAGR